MGLAIGGGVISMPPPSVLKNNEWNIPRRSEMTLPPVASRARGAPRLLHEDSSHRRGGLARKLYRDSYERHIDIVYL